MAVFFFFAKMLLRPNKVESPQYAYCSLEGNRRQELRTVHVGKRRRCHLTQSNCDSERSTARNSIYGFFQVVKHYASTLYPFQSCFQESREIKILSWINPIGQFWIQDAALILVGLPFVVSFVILKTLQGVALIHENNFVSFSQSD